MRIAYILTALGVGGAERQVIQLAERMAARGHAVTLIVLTHSDEELPARLPIMRLNLKKTPGGILKGLQFAARFLVLFRPDVLHSHTYPANIFARLLGFFRPLDAARPKLVNTIHNEYEGGWHRSLIYSATGLLVDRITSVSSAAAKGYGGWFGAKSEIRVISNGIDVGAFTSDVGRRKRVRKAFGLRSEFIWIAVGRLVEAKDYPNLLKAWTEVHSKYSEARLWIVGEGDGQFSEPSAPGVRFLGVRHDVADLLDAADSYVLSSAWEGMPLAVGEAMAMQMPVVTTDVGGVRELVGDAGRIVPARDSRRLSAAMLEIMAADELDRRALGQRARIRVAEHFSIEWKADEWESFYGSLFEAKEQ